MAKPQTWLEQLNRYGVPLVVAAIGVYGTWDLIVQPWMRVEQPVEVCSTRIFDVAVLKPSPKPEEPPKRIQAPEGLPLVVPAGETRIFSVDMDNPDQKPVVYQWRSTYGQFASRVTVEGKTTYTAPRSLVNDKITVEATLQGCAPVKRTVELAIVPSAKFPLANDPLPMPLEPPTPMPSIPSSLPTIDPFADPPRR